MNLTISDHAVDRFIERIAPGMRPSEARDFLREAAVSAKPLRERTRAGQEQWLVHEPYACILIVRKAYAHEGGRIVITVVPPRTEETDQQALGVLAAGRKYLEAQQALIEREPGISKGERKERIECLKLELQVLRHAERSALRDADLTKTRILAAAKKEEARAITERRRVEEEEKTKRHQASQDAEFVRMKRALRHAVRGIMTGDVATAARHIEAVHAGYLRPDFWKDDLWKDGDE